MQMGIRVEMKNTARLQNGILFNNLIAEKMQLDDIPILEPNFGSKNTLVTAVQ